MRPTILMQLLPTRGGHQRVVFPILALALSAGLLYYHKPIGTTAPSALLHAEQQPRYRAQRVHADSSLLSPPPSPPSPTLPREPAPPPAPPSISKRARRREQACVVDGGFYDGTWVHRPNASRPDILYVSESHKPWGRLERAFRKQYPADKVGGGHGGDGVCCDGHGGVAAFPKHSPQKRYFLPYNEYDWEPRDGACSLKPLDREVMCEILTKHLNTSEVLFVGDSISDMMAQSFLALMGNTVRHQWETTDTVICKGHYPRPPVGEGKGGGGHGGNDNNNHHHHHKNGSSSSSRGGGGSERATTTPKGGGGGGVSVTFIWDDQMNPYWKPVLQSGDLPPEYTWSEYMNKYRPGVMVLSWGPHVYSLETYKSQTSNVVDYLKTHMPPETHLLLRTTYTGHPNCWDYDGPTLTNDHPVSDYKIEINKEPYLTYKWQYFEEYNRIAVPRFRDELHADIFPVERLTYHRPDGHYMGGKKDCYHYQLPGIPDWWNKVLYNVWRARFGYDDDE